MTEISATDPQSVSQPQTTEGNSGAVAVHTHPAGANEVAVRDEPQSMLALIDRLARDPKCDVEKLERILALQERLTAREAEAEFNAAMERLARRLADIRIVRTRSVMYAVDKNDARKGQAEAFKFTPLEDIDKVLRGPLLEEGFTLSDTTEGGSEGTCIVVTRVTHRAGHHREARIPLPFDTSGGKSNVQGRGSSYSYGRRYNRVGLFNLVTLDDDDGMGGVIDAVQTKHIRQLMSELGANENRFLTYMKAQSVETILYRDYRKAVSALEERIAKARANADNSSS